MKRITKKLILILIVYMTSAPLLYSAVTFETIELFSVKEKYHPDMGVIEEKRFVRLNIIIKVGKNFDKTKNYPIVFVNKGKRYEITNGNKIDDNSYEFNKDIPISDISDWEAMLVFKVRNKRAGHNILIREGTFIPIQYGIPDVKSNGKVEWNKIEADIAAYDAKIFAFRDNQKKAPGDKKIGSEILKEGEFEILTDNPLFKLEKKLWEDMVFDVADTGLSSGEYALRVEATSTHISNLNQVPEEIIMSVSRYYSKITIGRGK